MTIKLTPEDEKLVQERLSTGVFANAEEVIHRALESLDAEEQWLQQNKRSIIEKIERGIGQIERGEGLSPEKAKELMETKKAA